MNGSWERKVPPAWGEKGRLAGAAAGRARPLARPQLRHLRDATPPADSWHPAAPHHCPQSQELWPACSLVFDGGQLPAGRAGSTVIDLTEPGQFHIRRRGTGFARAMQLLPTKYGLAHVLDADSDTGSE